MISSTKLPSHIRAHAPPITDLTHEATVSFSFQPNPRLKRKPSCTCCSNICTIRAFLARGWDPGPPIESSYDLSRRRWLEEYFGSELVAGRLHVAFDIHFWMVQAFVPSRLSGSFDGQTCEANRGCKVRMLRLRVRAL